MNKYRIIYVNNLGKKDSRVYKDCTDSLGAINKLLNYIQVKRIVSVNVIPEKTLFDEAQ